MGKLNLLKGSWTGKVGQTVGGKWKSKSTIRTYTTPSNPNTVAQQKVRGVFKNMTSFVALFADQIKYLSALDTSGMSVRNAIIKLNRDMIANDDYDKTKLIISKGGLQKPMGATATFDATKKTVNLTWSKPTATNFTEAAEIVIVVVDDVEQTVDVFTAAANELSASGTVAFVDVADISVYAYFLDIRGSNKIASMSVNVPIA